MENKNFIKLSKTTEYGKFYILVDKVGAQIVDCGLQLHNDSKIIHLMHMGATTPGTSWNATAKNLFPNPGPVLPKDFEGFDKDQKETLLALNSNAEDKVKAYTNRGGIYKMAQHGFAQSMEFKVLGKSSKYCVLRLRSNDETYSQYPCEFSYTVIPSIEEDGFAINYQTSVNNLDNKPIIAGMGWHPSFAMYFGKKNYVISYIDKKTRNIKYIPAEEIIKNGSKMLKEGSTEVKLIYIEPISKKRMDVVTLKSDCEKIVLWGKEDNTSSDFICIEPWNSESRSISKLSKKKMMSNKDIEDLKDEGVAVVLPGEEKFLIATVNFDETYLRHMLTKIKYKEEELEDSIDNTL